KKRGWGLGLSLVKRIIEEYHGGRVTLKRSKPGETVFEILLPCKPGLTKENKTG
ncbi:MAG: histidine kinase, partial [candidate division Zixibacteria bacterium]|nr:histidine kinase [candidate division Zixibacteria bacterium]